MNHSFRPSQLDIVKCATCKRSEKDHSKEAECEACGAIGVCELYIDILMCGNCVSKELELQVSNAANAEKRVEELPLATADNYAKHAHLMASQIDSTVQTVGDLFNANTVSIVASMKSIDEDESIPVDKKEYSKAKFLTDRFIKLRETIFNLDETRIAHVNEQRAIQTYLNTLANKLRAEEREELKIKDINYKPGEVKIVKPKAPKIEKKWDKSSVRAAANESGIAEYLIQTACIARNVTPTDAVNIIRRAMAEAPSMVENNNDDKAVNS